MDFYYRRCNSRRTFVGSFVRWRILGVKYVRLVSVDFVDLSLVIFFRRVCVDRRYRYYVSRLRIVV